MIRTSWVLLVLSIRVENADTASAPTWNSPRDGSSYRIDVTSPNACSEIDILDASSTDTAVVKFIISSTSPLAEGAFSIGMNRNDEDILQCTTNLLTAPSYNVTIKAASTLNSSFYRAITVTVTVLGLPPENRAPIFTNMPAKAKVLRDKFETGGPFVLFKVNVSDADSYNVSLALTTTDTSLFSLDETNIIVIASLENLTSPYFLTVKASDDGTPVRTSTAELTLIIGYAPKFDNLTTPKLVFVDETPELEKKVFELTVSDLDTTLEPITTILSQSIPWAFKLRGIAVLTNTSLDKETLSNYTIQFRASDGNFSTDSALLTIVVNDVNEAPVITSILPNATITLNELTAAGTNVLNVTASDPDTTAPNDIITYSLSDSNDFSIDNTTGMISLAFNTHLNNTSKSKYVLVVIARDGGIPPLSATTSVTIIIEPDTIDCRTDSCSNNGKCTDGINSFTCNCSEDWTGSGCTNACTGNKWGRNCAKSCICPNASRLASNVGDQQCDVKSGACKCNDKWTGMDCNTDYDECQNATICFKSVCRNTEGSYLCEPLAILNGHPGTTSYLGLILGLTLGLFLPLLLAIIAVLCYCKRKKQYKESTYYINSSYTVELPENI